MLKGMLSFLFICTVGLLIASGNAWAMQPYLQKLCQDPNYTCVKVHKGETWESLFADPELRGIVMRLNRINIQPKPNQLIVVPNNMATIQLMDLAPFERKITPPGQKTLVYDPAIHAWAAYSPEGDLVKWGPGSSGRDYCPDIGSRCHTTTGEFQVYRKAGAKCASTKFPIPNGGAPMPYCMFFNKGYAFHASNEVPGYNASHGCVRMFLEDARWLNQEFIALPAEGGTKVIIHDYPQASQT